MKSWRFYEFGSLSNLTLEDIPMPKPGPNEALIRLEYAALNPADAYLICGKYPRAATPPFAVGRDGCGVIERTHDDSRFKRGDRVVILRSDIGVSREGTLAEFVCVPEDSLAPLPQGWSPEEGAAGPLVYLTAWQALVTKGEVAAGKTVLVNGASGGVGSAAIMLAHAYGAQVIALSRHPEKRRQLMEIGAYAALDTADPNLEQAVKHALGGGRVDIVIENLSGHYLQTSINLAAEQGRIMIVGLLAGLTSEIKIANIIFKRLRLEGVAVGAYTPAEAQYDWEQIVDRLKRINMRPLVDKVFPMAEVPLAFAHLARGPMGKVVVDVRSA